jgi:hypothetical protein
VQENLAQSLNQIMHLLADFVQHFNVASMSEHTEEGTFFAELNSALRFAGRVEEVGPSGPALLPVSMEIFRVVAVSVGREAGWLEGCFCHSELIRSSKNHDHRMKLMRNAGVASGVCAWQGRRGIEMAMGRGQIILANIAASSSKRLSELLWGIDPRWRGHFVLMHRRLIDKVCDSLSAKLTMWVAPPLKLLAGLAEFAGGSREDSKSAIRSCFAYADSQSDVQTLSRVSQRFLLQDSPFRLQLQVYLDADCALHEFPQVYRELLS